MCRPLVGIVGCIPLLWLLAPVPALGVCTAPNFFDPPIPFVTGPNPLFVIVEDFNEDGIKDLAVTNSDFLHDGAASSVAVLAGTGPRAFGSAVQYALPEGRVPVGMVAGDFDEDGIVDLAVANKFTSNISILRGAGSGGVGNGAFAPPVNYPAGGWAFQIVTADFDEDGILDLAVSINNFGAVAVLLGQGSGGVGDGSFGSPALYPLTHPSIGLDLGDFNEDGIVDLVAAAPAGRLSVLLGQGTGGVGNGTFGPAAHFGTGISPFDIAVGDFNDDSIADLAVAGGGGTAIMLGNGSAGTGNGTFTLASTIPSGNSVGVVAADVNDDGIDDLAIAVDPGYDDGHIAVYLGQGSGGVGNGTFGFHGTRDIGGSPYQLTATDVDGDGFVDLLGAALYGDYISVIPGACGAGPPDVRSPNLTDVRDVPNDQGGRVFLTWNASSLDVTGGPVNSYRVWRRIPTALALASLWPEGGLPWLATQSIQPDGSTDVTYWEALVTLPAQRLPGYGYTAPTTQDSMTNSNPYTAFFVTALTNNIDVFYSSNVDSGYSVDNLRPGQPGSLAGEVVAGPGYRLQWEPPDDPDIAVYRVYRGAPSVTDLSEAELIATLGENEYTDSGSMGAFRYWVAAVDTHENEGEAAMLEPIAPLSAEPSPSALALTGARPNPSRSGSFSVSFTLPDSRPARLEVLDIAGRLVSTLQPHSGAGAQTLRVAGERGLAPGLYLIRLVHGGRTLETKAVVTQ